MIISIHKPSWANTDDEKYIEIEIRWPKRPPRGWVYIQEVHLSKVTKLLESGSKALNPADYFVSAERMLRRSVSRMPR